MSFNLDDYEPVAVRLARWLEAAEDPRVITHLVHYTEGQSCVFRAELYEGDKLIATGWAEERVENRGVNQRSHLENCESSALGRGLANAGLAGSDPAKRPSREEMLKAQRAQATTQRTPIGSAAAPPPVTNIGPELATDKQHFLIGKLAEQKGYKPHFDKATITKQEAMRLIDEMKEMPDVDPF